MREDAGALDDDGFGFRRQLANHDGYAWLEDAGLLAGDGRQGGPQVFLMVEPDGCDHADLRAA